MLKIISSIIWSITFISIIYLSVLLTNKLNFIQFKFKKMFKYLKNKKSISVLSMTLGARIGIGSIAGVALAIYLGGEGTLFWIWFSSFLGSIISFSETYLAIKYKNNNKGGPYYYIKNGVKNNKLALFYSYMIIISYILGFSSIQSNTITKSINQIIKIDNYLIGIILIIIISIIIIKGLKNIVKIITKLIPFITMSYLLITFIIIIRNYYLLPNIFISIITKAFNFKSFITSFIPTMIIGLQRGIFSSEAGMGTCSISSSTIGYDDKIGNGCIQMIGIYITSLLICTSTGLVILTSKYNLNIQNGIELTQMAYNYHLGSLGNYFIFITIFLFSFSTILTGYYDSEISLKTITNKYTNLLKIISLISIFLGTLLSPKLIWESIDIIVGILSLINIYSILKLKNEIKV